LGDQGYAVVKVEKVLPRESRDAKALQQEAQQYGQWWAAAEGQAYYNALKERFKVRIDVPAPKPVSGAAG
jgi:peptidyl-prolyl cis-trans isomerase D